MTLTVAAVGLTIGLGTWGFDSLRFTDEPKQLGAPLALYRAVRLYTLDLGPATGAGGAPRPNWQLWVAFALAAALVLRGALLLWRERIRRFTTRYVLRRHVVVCGGGVHGARLVHELAEKHDVVLVDNEPTALGMLAPRGKHEWRLVGDCVRVETLVAAGVARANWVVSIPGNDFVSSQVVSAVRSLAKSGRVRARVHVLVQVEDPTLARFLEEEEDVEKGAGEPGASASSLSKMSSPVVSPFSANAIAAETLLDESEVDLGGSGTLEMFLHMRNGEAPNLLLAGDHPLIDAVVLAVLRRWRVRVLRELESTSPHQRPPVHVSVIGPGAVSRVEGFYARWGPEAEVLSIEARDIEGASGSLDGAEDWLRKPDRADHAIVACLDELDGVRLTLELSRALGGAVRMTRVNAQLESALDAHLEERTMRSDELATTSVKSLADLACRPAVMGRLEGPQRLADALARDSSSSDGPAGLSAELYERANTLGLRSDSAWRVRPCERPLLQALLYPVPLSAVVRAGLKVELARPSNLRYVAERLSATGSPAAFAAWCEYVRHVALADDQAALATPSPDENANDLMKLRRATLGDSQALAGLHPRASVLEGAGRVAIIAGAAGNLQANAGPELARLLGTALCRYDGVVLSGGTAAGVPGIVGAVAREQGLSQRLVGYAPEGRADRHLYPTVRETPGSRE
ncbi:MAG: NAD-binding protein, partial [Acidimicrobiales bacterium]